MSTFFSETGIQAAMRRCMALLIILFAGGCQTGVHNNMSSVQWMQNAYEYRAVAQNVYRSASEAMERGLSDPHWSAELSQQNQKGIEALPSAVVLDFDETVLDNSPFQAQLMLDNTSFSSEMWDDWIAKESAGAIPGALDFVRQAHASGVRVFYISNRPCRQRSNDSSLCPQKRNTINNLKKLGFPVDGVGRNILLKNEKPAWNAEKLSRRQVIAKQYRILLLIGDDLSDFIPHVGQAKTLVERNRTADRYRDYWGEKWFVLPNPSYGSWLRTLQRQPQQLRGYR